MNALLRELLAPVEPPLRPLPLLPPVSVAWRWHELRAALQWQQACCQQLNGCQAWPAALAE